ncbi:hypothetical protein DFP72DRAFT_843984 [Ephemerocybe angulata]|uniref:Uncharacterized protein n=1 Tax=Ephemerocybe angulata TaxID=980116 RepID=A0A8H6M9E5_9AGAR|nr:hypothetical protein DFP72DRAFT_843984 [Tulosesus angulatus]
MCQGHGYMRGGYLLGGVGKREKGKCRVLYSFHVKGLVEGEPLSQISRENELKVVALIPRFHLSPLHHRRRRAFVVDMLWSSLLDELFFELDAGDGRSRGFSVHSELVSFLTSFVLGLKSCRSLDTTGRSAMGWVVRLEGYGARLPQGWRAAVDISYNAGNAGDNVDAVRWFGWVEGDGMGSLTWAMSESDYTTGVEPPGVYTMPSESSSRRADLAGTARERPFLRRVHCLCGGDGRVARLGKGAILLRRQFNYHNIGDGPDTTSDASLLSSPRPRAANGCCFPIIPVPTDANSTHHRQRCECEDQPRDNLERCTDPRGMTCERPRTPGKSPLNVSLRKTPAWSIDHRGLDARPTITLGVRRPSGGNACHVKPSCLRDDKRQQGLDMVSNDDGHALVNSNTLRPTTMCSTRRSIVSRITAAAACGLRQHIFLQRFKRDSLLALQESENTSIPSPIYKRVPENLNIAQLQENSCAAHTTGSDIIKAPAASRAGQVEIVPTDNAIAAPGAIRIYQPEA